MALPGVTTAPRSQADRDDAARLRPIRAAAVIVLTTQLVFLPLEARYKHGFVLTAHVILYSVSALLTVGVLAISWTRWGRQHADGLAFSLSLGLAASILAYFWIDPSSPVLVAQGLTCLLIGSAVLTLWSVARTTATALACGVVFALIGAARLPSDQHRSAFAFGMAALVLGGGVAIACAATLVRVRGSLARRERELSDLSARLMSVQEEERQRLSRELHDELGQSLTAVLSYLWLIERQLPEALAELRGPTAEARHLASKILAQIRVLSQLLRPSVLDDYGLVPSLDAHVKAFAEREQIATSFTADTLPHRLSPEIETAVYRITQEALTNVARHARAHQVSVRLDVDRGELRLHVEDDGVGIPSGHRPGANGGGVGLIGIRERVRALGGTMKLDSAPGARLEVRLPLPADRAES